MSGPATRRPSRPAPFSSISVGPGRFAAGWLPQPGSVKAVPFQIRGAIFFSLSPPEPFRLLVQNLSRATPSHLFSFLLHLSNSPLSPLSFLSRKTLHLCHHVYRHQKQGPGHAGKSSCHSLQSIKCRVPAIGATASMTSHCTAYLGFPIACHPGQGDITCRSSCRRRCLCFPCYPRRR